MAAVTRAISEEKTDWSGQLILLDVINIFSRWRQQLKISLLSALGINEGTNELKLIMKVMSFLNKLNLIPFKKKCMIKF